MTLRAIWESRAAGCLYGLALGDAMGMPAELWPRKKVLRHFGEITGFLPGPPGHFIVDGFVAGQVTDDTQQAVTLAEAIIDADGQVDPDGVARHLVAWADRIGASEGNFLGPNSARALDALRQGKPIAATGLRGDTNGAAMRIAPVGILSPSGDLEKLVDRVQAACLFSHNTDIAIAGAAMVAAAISVALDRAGSDDARLDPLITAALRACDLGMERGEEVPGASLPRRTLQALEIARCAKHDQEFLQDLYDLMGAGVATTETIPCVFAIVARADGDLAKATYLAANLGGDTDTIGAIVGAICGAINGVEVIPPEQLHTLRTVNDLDLSPLATRLVAQRAKLSGRLAEVPA